MTNEQNIRAILTCIFYGYKDELIDLAVTRILETIDAESSWIPVAERLPENEEELYLITIGNSVYLDYFVDGHFLADNPERILAWMPLPEPYRS